ncbi:DUF3850 domain-containing protein [Paenibacillus alvei]|uniref:DUF3850 domain-containing protein n=1 Tax=Paenibacillus alvei TaxID=44250 RepID=A0ABT4E5Y3_PAEAL|nr:DUF3850 domain-containing protein [Paenibacillus alvei]MCY9529152.1 DUF3850 domain-containing protein [Paenibacillus alvei]
MLHDKKIKPEYFSQVMAGNMNFIACKNDVECRIGDVLVLREWEPEKQEYTSEVLWCEITHILDDQYFLRDGAVVLGISHLNEFGQLIMPHFDSWPEFIKAIGAMMIREKKMLEVVKGILLVTSKAGAHTEAANIHFRLRTALKEIYGGDVFETERKEK